ncbi:MAG: citrate/2-methylcitrate synthase [Candidatus Caenarcaniphilales bacterium]|nr:citrate/2-methylcitrate synthase [Candidatus Caenarcaniphilales bacterium]
MTQTKVETSKGGLEGVIAGESKICLIDGEKRKLYYRGYSAADLAQKSCFEETAYLLLTGNLPNQKELEDFKADLLTARYIPTQVLAMIALVPPHTHPMDVLRSIVSSLSQHESEVADNSPEANLRKATKLLAQAPVIVAAYHRLRNGLQPVPPMKKLSLAANFLYMLSGEEPDQYSQEVFDDCLILHADHGFNASTFTARVTAATLSDMHSAVTAAIGALKGKLHGGANQDVMELLKRIGSADNAIPTISKMFENGEKVPGFGHRVYRNCEDPRATILREASKELSARENNDKWFKISEAVDKFVVKTSEEKGKAIFPNVDFYSASTYSVLGIETELFTPIFAMSRLAGWCAHIMEQHENNRLIRPKAQYIGERDLSYLEISKR